MNQRIEVKIGEPFEPMTIYPVNNPQSLFNHLGEQRLVEPKLNGIRCIIHKKGDNVWLFSRNKNDITDKFPVIAEAVKKYIGDFILDGELVVMKNNKCDFKAVVQQLRNGITNEKNMFFAFDVLHFAGYDVCKLPYIKRRSALEELPITDRIRVITEAIARTGEELKKHYVECIKRGFEGIVIRDLYHYYIFERTPKVQKLKPVRTIDVKIIEEKSKKENFHRYIVAQKEGTVCVIPTTKKLEVGSIITIKHEGLIESSKYPLGFSLMMARFVNVHPTKNEPDSEEILKC